MSPNFVCFLMKWCQGHVEWKRSDPEWKRVNNKSRGTTLALALALCLDLLSHIWLCISGGQNCCQEIRRGVVYRLIGVEMDIKDVNVSQTSFGHISINSPSILTVSMATENP